MLHDQLLSTIEVAPEKTNYREPTLVDVRSKSFPQQTEVSLQDLTRSDLESKRRLDFEMR